MDLAAPSILEVLNYLLPGFISAAIAYNLTPSPRPIPFERVIQALIFTIVIQVLVLGVRSVFLWFGESVRPLGVWSGGARLTWSVILAGALGLLLAHLTNTDRLHALLRRARITNQTSYPSEWYGALSQNKGFVVLHLSGERRLYGWPEEWPSAPNTGHFAMSFPQWLTDGGVIEPAGVDKILVRAQDVEMVELMRPIPIPKTETDRGRAKGTDAPAEPTALTRPAGHNEGIGPVVAPASPEAYIPSTAAAEEVKADGIPG